MAESLITSKADYVVEEGVSGIWRYRKWASGIAECWGATASTSHAMTSQSNNGWYASEQYSLPSGLFTAVTNVQANRNGGGGLVFISVYGTSTSTINYYVCTVSGSMTSSFSILLSVKGRWK